MTLLFTAQSVNPNVVYFNRLVLSSAHTIRRINALTQEVAQSCPSGLDASSGTFNGSFRYALESSQSRQSGRYDLHARRDL